MDVKKIQLRVLLFGEECQVLERAYSVPNSVRRSYRKCKQCRLAKLTDEYSYTARGLSIAECKSCEDKNA